MSTNTTTTQSQASSFNWGDYDLLVSEFKDKVFYTAQNFLEVQPCPAMTYFKLRLPTALKPQVFTSKEPPEQHLDNSIYHFTSLIEEHIPLLAFTQTDNSQQIQGNPIGYIWLKEQCSENDIVYHFLLLTNQQVEFYLGNEMTKTRTLYNHIAQYWCDAVKLDVKDFNWLATQRSRTMHKFGKNRLPPTLLNIVDNLALRMRLMAQVYPEAWEDGLAFLGTSKAKYRS